MTLPSKNGAIPSLVTSTSGNSGIDYVTTE
jgi:hypothetical protein